MAQLSTVPGSAARQRVLEGRGKRAKNLKELRESEAPNFPGELSSTTSNFQLNHHVKALLKTPAGNCDQDKFR